MTQAMLFDDLDWQADAMNALLKVALEGKPFDAYSLTEKAELRDPPHPNMWGPLFHEAARLGYIKPIGYHKSRRPGRSGGACRVWAVST